MPVKTLDLEANWQGQEERMVVQLQALQQDPAADTDANMNRLVLRSGRMPQAANECVVHVMGYQAEIAEGTVLALPEDTEGTKHKEYTVVGLVQDPQHISTDKESSTVGNGQLNYIAYVLDGELTADYYTACYIKTENAGQYDNYSQEYQEAVDQVADRLEQISTAQCVQRREQLIDTANQKLAEARQTYDDQKAEAEQKIEEQKQEQHDEAVARQREEHPEMHWPVITPINMFVKKPGETPATTAGATGSGANTAAGSENATATASTVNAGNAEHTAEAANTENAGTTAASAATAAQPQPTILSDPLTPERKDEVGALVYEPTLKPDMLKELNLQETLFLEAALLIAHKQHPLDNYDQNRQVIRNHFLDMVRAQQKIYVLYDARTGYPLLDGSFVLMYLDKEHAEIAAKLYAEQLRSDLARMDRALAQTEKDTPPACPERKQDG